MGVRVAGKLSISRAWDETREIFRRDGNLLVAVALALIVLPGVVVGLIGPQTSGTEQVSGGIQILRLVAALITLVGQLALIRLALGPSTTVGNAIGHGFKRFPYALGAFIILILILLIILVPVGMVGALLSGVDPASMSSARPTGPAALLILLVLLVTLAVSVRFTLLSPVSSAESIGPIAIIRRCWELTKGHYWRLLGLAVLLLIAFIVLVMVAGLIGGILARLVSSDITPFSAAALIVALIGGIAQGAFSILASVMLARVYAQLAGRQEQVEEVFR
jgi:hypothetical protein